MPDVAENNSARHECDIGFQYSCKYRRWVPFTNPQSVTGGGALEGVPRRSWLFSNYSCIAGYPYEVNQTITRSDPGLPLYGGFNVKVTGPLVSNSSLQRTSNDTKNVVSIVWLRDTNQATNIDPFPLDGTGVQFKRSISIAINTDSDFGGPNPSFLCGVNWSNWTVVRRIKNPLSGVITSFESAWSIDDLASVDNSYPHGLFFTKLKSTHSQFSSDYSSELNGIEIRKLVSE
jgi:hypothetical protein